MASQCLCKVSTMTTSDPATKFLRHLTGLFNTALRVAGILLLVHTIAQGNF